MVLRDRRPKRVVDVADAVAEDVAEPDQHGQADPAEQQMVGELLEVDRLLGILRGVDQHVPGRRDREVAFPPPIDFVEVRGVANREGFASLPAPMTSCCRGTHCES